MSTRITMNLLSCEHKGYLREVRLVDIGMLLYVNGFIRDCFIHIVEFEMA